MGIYEVYKASVEDINEELDPDLLLSIGLFSGAISIIYIGLFYDIFLGILISISIMDVIVGYPLYKAQTRIEKMEKMLPDVLMHISTSLRAGGTVESALKEVSTGRYGTLATEMRKMLIRMKEGKTFEEAFEDFANSTGSDIFKRTANVIISARRAGGGMSEALMSIASDVREIYKIKSDRRAKTTTYVLFMLVSAVLIAPIIFGIVSGIMLFLGKVAGQAATPLFGSMIFYFKAYLAISALFGALMASLVREGNFSRSVLYAPIFILIAYVTYVVVSNFAVGFFSIG